MNKAEDDILAQAGHRPLVMGILNVTPDSFSDGGKFLSAEQIVRRTDDMIAAGADIIDNGGESSRPFAEPVTIDQEIARVIPALQAIRKHHHIPISIDTTKATVARQALAAGATMINDISALRFDPEMVEVVRESSSPVVLMHMQGTPGDMQISPKYDNVVDEVYDFLQARVAWAENQGLRRSRICIDPGIGFGKTVEHNLMLLKNLAVFKDIDCPILVGHSRKSFLGKILDLDVTERDNPTAVLSALCALNGAAILRVHDVGSTVEAVKLAQAVMAAGCAGPPERK